MSVSVAVSSSEHPLLEGYLKQLRLTTFIQNYVAFAQDAAQENRSYEQFLLALAQQETAQRDLNAQRQRIKGARFPVIKELADFDFSAVPKLNKQRLLALARGEYIAQAEPIILVGNPGLGKTHPGNYPSRNERIILRNRYHH
jgi:DNA replication protein DnaC